MPRTEGPRRLAVRSEQCLRCVTEECGLARTNPITKAEGFDLCGLGGALARESARTEIRRWRSA
jgi:hypothetical protein